MSSERSWPLEVVFSGTADQVDNARDRVNAHLEKEWSDQLIPGLIRVGHQTLHRVDMSYAVV